MSEGKCNCWDGWTREQIAGLKLLAFQTWLKAATNPPVRSSIQAVEAALNTPIDTDAIKARVGTVGDAIAQSEDDD